MFSVILPGYFTETEVNEITEEEIKEFITYAAFGTIADLNKTNKELNARLEEITAGYESIKNALEEQLEINAELKKALFERSK